MNWPQKVCMYLLWLYFVVSIAVGVFFWLWLLYIVIQVMTETAWLIVCSVVTVIAFTLFAFEARRMWKAYTTNEHDP